jgi:Ca2+-dependent lipid-binding protein
MVAIKEIFRAKLEVIVREATGLRAADVTGLSDPYVRITIDDAKDQYRNHEWRTPVCKETLTPSWNFSFTTELRVDPLESAAALVFDVFDHDVVSLDDFLGITHT